MEPQIITEEAHPPTTPFFTVGITTYKRPARLAKAIQSVSAQTFTDYELIIVDDASPDDTEQKVKEFDNPKITYVRQPTNQGVSQARNEVIRRARGDFIVLLDDDDWFAPDFLHFVHEAMVAVSPAVAFAVPGRTMIQETEDGEIQRKAEILPYTSLTELAGSDYLQLPLSGGSGLIIRTSAARATNGFEADWVPVDDTYFMIQLATTWNFAVIPQAILYVLNHQGTQLTRHVATMAPKQERLGDSEYLRLYPGTRARIYRICGRMFYSIHQRQDGRRCMLKAIKAAPFSYKSWTLFILLEMNSFLPNSYRRRLLSSYRHSYPST
jgi:glycosyltransferase involved in cell wall biosynthesis